MRGRCTCSCVDPGECPQGRLEAARACHPFGGSALTITPFGQRIRSLREQRGISLSELAAAVHVSPAYLSALEHGKRGRPSAGLIHQVNEHFGLIWDDAEELVRLARLSHPRVVVDTAGLSPQATELANRLARTIADLPEERIAALLAMLDCPQD